MLPNFPPEVHEIMSYLAGTPKKYAIFAGFGCYLTVGTKTSFDVDVLVASQKNVIEVAQDFAKHGWEKAEEEIDGKEFFNWVMRKNDSDLDLIYSRHATKNFIQHTTKKPFGLNRVSVLTPEALLLIKLNQMSRPTRSPEKMQRDKDTILALRKIIRPKILSQIAKDLGDRYWQTGRF